MPFELFHSQPSDSTPVTIPAIGLQLVVRMPPKASGDALTIIETINAPGFGPPLHRHAETEIFRVLEGRYLFEVDGQRFEASDGDVVSVPGGCAHAFLNMGSAPARQLVIILPGMDAEKFFIGLGDIFADGRPDHTALSAFGAPWGVEFLGPPISR